ncbi:MAG: hypothetical protein LBV36_00905 [Chromatiales bacterium]|jgi:hypothetical protein|nr:hypothetical protein [Chromatiales bacterium]
MIVSRSRIESDPPRFEAATRRVEPVVSTTAVNPLPTQERRVWERRKERTPILLDTRCGNDRRSQLRNV